METRHGKHVGHPTSACEGSEPRYPRVPKGTYVHWGYSGEILGEHLCKRISCGGGGIESLSPIVLLVVTLLRGVAECSPRLGLLRGVAECSPRLGPCATSAHLFSNLLSAVQESLLRGSQPMLVSLIACVQIMCRLVMPSAVRGTDYELPVSLLILRIGLRGKAHTCVLLMCGLVYT